LHKRYYYAKLELVRQEDNMGLAGGVLSTGTIGDCAALAMCLQIGWSK